MKMIISRLLLLIFMLAAPASAGILSDIIDYASKYFNQCNPYHLKRDISGLTSDLKTFVFGQPLVADVVVNALKGHISSSPAKPLTLSFHGWTGSGKNYVADMIVTNVFSIGYSNPNVHVFVAKLHFPSQHLVTEYQIQLRDKIIQSVKACEYSVFIFDEVDKFPAGVLDVVKPFLDYKVNINGVDYRHSLFIFISNIGANVIVDRTLELWRNGKRRQDFQLRDFEQLLIVEAFNEKGGFYRSDVIDSHLIDHYVPFLPLEESHVRLCATVELVRYTSPVEGTKKLILDEVIGDLQFGPEPENLFSVAGCKRVSQLVARLAMKHRLQYRKRKTEL